MKLIGTFESPFVRRVAITLKLYELPFDHLAARTTDRATVEKLNPLGRIPALILDSGEALIDSTMIVDYLDELVGPERALTPRTGEARRAINRLVAVSTGICDKYVAAYYEYSKRPESHYWAPWRDRIDDQMRGGLRYLDSQVAGPRFFGGAITQADVAAVAAIEATRFDQRHIAPQGTFLGLDALIGSVADMPAFRETRPV